LSTDFVLIDMDGTILAKRSIDVLCQSYGLTSSLRRIDKEFREQPKSVVGRMIVNLFVGKSKVDMERIFDSISLSDGIRELLSYFKSRGFVVALATDGYKFLADKLKEKLPLDLVYGNVLEFNGDILSGQAQSGPGCLKILGCKEYSICKLRLLKTLRYSLGGRAIAVGDSEADYCMLRTADISIAYRPKTERIKEEADLVTDHFDKVLSFLKCQLG